ncbi:YihY/virulence factor BrkB family protein [Nesterenkonia sp. E16_7]|uniref:YhjD/YihY/BrkB family envelope integrity protein n=1 Tax=unclassified Nesterenkonia TaxID=2629769 RepID=UPI001A91617E|nr:YihY/virulence factor BrkB family protein [Nesterenkonia sp. E16_10]MBO0597350.1 YihY/virulence factor BrkB family protein [Nesterenkonia sp. E16_7]
MSENPSRLRPRTGGHGLIAGHARAAAKAMNDREEVSGMVNPLDLEGLRRREVKARRAWGHARREGRGRASMFGLTLFWGLTRLDTTRGMRILNLFLFHYGTVMAAGAAYMMFFSVSAALVAGFSVAGLVIGGDQQLQDTIVELTNDALPGVIGEDGLATQEQLFDTDGFTLTLVVSLLVAAVASLSWINGLRAGIRSIFDRPLMDENVLLVKSRDLGVMLLLGTMLLAATATSLLSESVLNFSEEVLSWNLNVLQGLVGTLITLAVPLILDVLVAVLIFRVASRVVMPVSVLWRAALLAAVGSSVLRQLSTFLLSGVEGGNLIVSSFATVLGFFVYFFLLSLIYLLCAAWAALATDARSRRLGPVAAAR